MSVSVSYINYPHLFSCKYPCTYESSQYFYEKNSEKWNKRNLKTSFSYSVVSNSIRYLYVYHGERQNDNTHKSEIDGKHKTASQNDQLVYRPDFCFLRMSLGKKNVLPRFLQSCYPNLLAALLPLHFCGI